MSLDSSIQLVVAGEASALSKRAAPTYALRLSMALGLLHHASGEVPPVRIAA